MPTPTKGPRLGGGPAHERLMLANLATSLFEHGRITTTEARAKRLRPLAERLITFAKRGDLHSRRQVLSVVRDKEVVHSLFAEIGPGFAERAGGYTRITKVGPRKGDNARMAVIELVEFRTVAQEAVAEAEQARGSRFARRRRPTGATAESAAELAGESETAANVAAESAQEDVAAESAQEDVAAESAQEDVAAEAAQEDVVAEGDAAETESAPADQPVAPDAAADAETAGTDTEAEAARTEEADAAPADAAPAEAAPAEAPQPEAAPAEEVTSEQTAEATDESPAEGDADKA